MSEPLTPAAAAQPASTADRAALVGPSSERAAKVRAEVQRILRAEGISQSQLAGEAGINQGSVSPWLNDKWPGGGTGEHVLLALEKWLAARAVRAETAAKVPSVPAFLETPTARRIMADLTFAQMLPDLVCIGGPAGVGKTSAVQAYQRANPVVWVATLDPSASRVSGVLQEICDAIGITEPNQQYRRAAIVRRVTGTRGLLVIDEAQHATTQALDQVRAIHDRAKIGIALVGNETVYARLEGDGRKPAFAQLFSRLGARQTPRVKDADIALMLDAWEIRADDERRLAAEIARRPGHLRNLAKTMVAAGLLAAGLNEPRGLKHIRTAYERLACSGAAGDGGAA